MARQGEALIVDASVALKWFMPPEREPKASLARELIGSASLMTTTLAVFEIANVLVRASGFSRAEIADALEILDEICGNPIPLTKDDRSAAVALADKHGLTFYDASYAAIAQRTRRTLVSADEDLIKPGLARGLG